MKKYPTWMTENLNKCMCGSNVILFYDESENYHVECTGCKSKVKYKTKQIVSYCSKGESRNARSEK